MNNTEAKFILQGYRPSGADAADATFAAALDQARRDPGLQDWFSREQAFDAAMSAKLAEIAVPAGLREAILAGGRVTVSEHRTRWWQHPALMAAAACLAVAAVATLALFSHPAEAADDFSTLALRDTLYNKAHGGHGVEAGALQAFLMSPKMRVGESLPVDYAALRRSGCRTLNLDGREVLEICFRRDGTWFHCYIAQRTDFPEIRPGSSPALSEVKGAGVAAWSDSAHLYVVVTKSGESAIGKLL
ncbi:MAG TPA: hypothetical protein VL200_04700 [Lacunisphaera sp.]|jgi:hypothetical protein|nr:hypothetical protein [Lacunisphaera sp.]